MGKTRSTPDWAVVKSDYRTGRFSNVQLAERHGTSESTIRRKVKEGEWKKDLTDEVRTATRVQMSQSLYQPDMTDDDVVEVAARENAGVLKAHRNRIQQWATITDQYADLISNQLKAGSMVIMHKGKPVEVDLPADYIGKCLSFGSGALERLIKLERQSYGIDDDDNNDVRPIHTLIDELRAGNDG